LNPVYDWTDWGGRTFKGYSLDQKITVKIRNFDKINDILDKATASGANDVGQLQFTVDDMEKIKAGIQKYWKNKRKGNEKCRVRINLCPTCSNSISPKE